MKVREGKLITFLSLFGLVILLMIQTFISNSPRPRAEPVPATSLTAFFDSPTMLPSSTPPVRGEIPPEFVLVGLDGQSHQLKDYRGKALILNFWASWCAPCQIEMPLLQKTAEQFTDKLVVVGIDTGEDEKAIRAFIEPRGLSFPILMDKDNIVARRYSVFGLPTTFFIDANGILKDGSLGPLTEDTLKLYLNGINISENN